MHSSAHGPTFNLARLLIWVLGGVLSLVSAVQIAVGYHVVRDYATRLLPIVFANAATQIGNSLLDDIAQDVSFDDALTRTYAEVERVVPGAALVIATNEGAIFKTAGGCTLATQNVDPKRFAAFRAPQITNERFSLPNPCKEPLRFLSAAPVALADRNAMLFLYAPPYFLDYLQRFEGTVSYFLRAITFALISLLAASWMLHGVYRRMMRQAENLAGDANRFLKGESPVPKDVGISREFTDVSNTLHTLSQEHQARLDDIETEDRARQQMMANIVHDMRTPMTAIEGCVSLLEQSAESPTRQKTYLNMICSAIRAQHELSANLLNVATLEDTFSQTMIQPVDLWLIVENYCLQLTTLFEQKGVGFTYRKNCLQSTIEGNEGMLGRVVLNLLSNALRYTHSNGNVAVEVNAREGKVVLEVRDTGIGISPSDAPKIFDDFYSGLSPEAKEIGGSGLGLAVVKRIVTLHQGEIGVESELGRGTTITLKFTEQLDSAKYAEASSLMPTAQHASKVSRSVQIPDSKGEELTLSKLSGLVLFFGTVFPIVCYFKSQSDITFLASTLSAGILLFDARSVLRTESWNVRFSSLALSFSLVLNFLAALSDNSRMIPGGAGVLLTWMFILVLHRSLREPVILLAIVVCAVIAMLHQYSSLTLLGMAFGLLPALTAIALDSNVTFRRIGLELTGIALLFTFVSSILQAGVLWFFSVQIPAIGNRAQASLVSARFAKLFTGNTPHADTVSELFATSHQYNPLIDFWLFSVNGEALVSNRIEKPLPFEFPSAEQSEVDADNMIAIQTFASKMFLTRYCAYSGCRQLFFMGIRSPGRDASYISIRMIQTGVVTFVIYALPTTVFLLLLTGMLLNRTITKRFAVVQTGLERYRRGIFSEPIALVSGGSIGTLVERLNELASRLPLLHEQVAERSAERKEFIRQIGVEIDGTASHILAIVPDSESRCTPEVIKNLKSRTGQQRALLESLFELLRLQLGGISLQSEPVVLQEIAAESLHIVGRQAEERGIQVEVLGFEHSCFVEADANYLARTLDYILQQVITFSDQGSRVSLEIVEASPHIQLVCVAHSFEFAGAKFDELNSGLSNARVPAGSLPFCGDFWFETYAYATNVLGGTLALKQISERSIAVELELHEVLRG